MGTLQVATRAARGGRRTFLLLAGPVLAAIAVIAGATPAAALTVETIRVGRGANLAFIDIVPRRPNGDAVILLSGGPGLLGLTGGRRRLGNFVVRSRRHFARAGYRLAIPDAPSDRQDIGLTDWRTSPGHVADMAKLVAWLRARGARRVWLVGTSRGTISAAMIAASVRVDGVVLTSSLTARHFRFPNVVQDAALNRIRVPVLIVHHRRDECFRTPPSGARELKAKFTAAPKAELMLFDGGQRLGRPGWANRFRHLPPHIVMRRRQCGPWSYHGFLGIEARVAGAIANWMRTQGKH